MPNSLPPRVGTWGSATTSFCRAGRAHRAPSMCATLQLRASPEAPSAGARAGPGGRLAGGAEVSLGFRGLHWLLVQRQVASQKGDQSPAKTSAGTGITLGGEDSRPRGLGQGLRFCCQRSFAEALISISQVALSLQGTHSPGHEVQAVKYARPPSAVSAMTPTTPLRTDFMPGAGDTRSSPLRALLPHIHPLSGAGNEARCGL